MDYFSQAFEALPLEWQKFLKDNDLESAVVLANLLPGEVPEFGEAPAKVKAFIELAKAIEFRDQRRAEQLSKQVMLVKKADFRGVCHPVPQQATFKAPHKGSPSYSKRFPRSQR